MKEHPRAGLGRRAAAFLLDGLVLIFPLLITAMIVSAIAGDLETGTGGWWIMLGLVFVEATLYFTILEARSGQTVGKRVFGLRVRTPDGGPISVRDAAIRNVLRIVDSQPGGFYLLGAAMVLAMPGKQRLGDLAAKTIVVRVVPVDVQVDGSVAADADFTVQADSRAA